LYGYISQGFSGDGFVKLSKTAIFSAFLSLYLRNLRRYVEINLQ